MREYGFYQKIKSGLCTIPDFTTTARNIGEATRKFREYVEEYNSSAEIKMATTSHFKCSELLSSFLERKG